MHEADGVNANQRCCRERPSRCGTARLGAMRLFALAALVFAPPASAVILNYHGKVVMEDGSPPGRRVGVQRNCPGTVDAVREANASAKTGVYFVHLYIEDSSNFYVTGWQRSTTLLACYLEAVLPGYTSTRINLGDWRITRNPQLPNIVLSRQRRGALVEVGPGLSVPRSARKPWAQALKELNARNWTGAETSLRTVVAKAPDFASAWAALGGVYQNQNKPAEARTALGRAIELEPKRLPPYLSLTTVQIALKDWEAAVRTSDALIQADTEHDYLGAYLANAVARYQKQDFDGALGRMNELVELDKQHSISRADYVLGVILEARGDLDAAARHLRQYVDEHPRAPDAAAARERIANLGKESAADLSGEMAAEDRWIGTTGEAAVPGGIKAFSAIAQMRTTPDYQDFFLQYCRAIIEGGPSGTNPTREASNAIRAFIYSVGELERLGERSGGKTVIRLAVDTEEHRAKTESVLTLLGWRLLQSGGGYAVEPGDQTVDGLRQRIPAALGIDELRMGDAIAGGRPFQFEIPIESARLVGGAAWTATLKPGTEAGSPVETFLRDWRFARLYTALGAMDSEVSGAVVSAVGLVSLLLNYSELLADHGEALSLDGDRVAVPGGAEADAVWTKLAGASPRNPAAFFRALLEKDRGLLMTFFFDLSRADAVRRRFVTATPGRAEAFYRCYRDSGGEEPVPASGRWQAVLLQKLPLDGNGSLRLPGGTEAWTGRAGAGEDVLFALPSLEPVAALARLEEARGRRLDAGSARLLVRNYREWRNLFPYFEKLPGLDEPQFQELSSFAAAASAAQPARQAALLGEWHSLVELVVMGSEAGSLNAAQAAGAFGKVCAAMHSANASAQALRTLREIAGGSDGVDEAVPARLLRLAGAKREAFDRVRELQGVPRIDSLGAAPDPAKTAAALSGLVYAALLDPEWLLVAEDPGLLARHDFLPRAENSAELFSDSGVVISNEPPGSKLTGGFGRFREVARVLDARSAGQASGNASESAVPEPGHTAATPPDPAPALLSSAPLFHAKGRIVEVYATVTDRRGRYVDDLDDSAFRIEVEGQPVRVSAFENHTTSVTVGLLFDTTGSMNDALPSLKRAALRLLDELRPGDSVGVYGFSERVAEFQPFTTDKTAAKAAVLRAHPAGRTALYDALVRVSRDLAQRRGKKVIIVFTDGDDNASMMTADAAILRARSRGIPIYTVAEGEALRHPRLVKRLGDLSTATGGAPFLIQKLEDIAGAFQRMSEDLVHGYLLAFQPPATENKVWHKISVAVPQRKGLTIRARQGYDSE